jgi:hypothetical protein
MKIIAGWVVAHVMIAATGTAIAVSVKPQQTSAERGCIGLGCRPANPVTQLESQASRVDRSQKADRIRIVVPAAEAVLPSACEPPFSPLAKLPSSRFIARCLT